MANFINSPNMGLPVPVIGVDPGPDWSTNLNNSLTIVDSHNHSSGSGVQITPAGLNLNADVSIQDNNLTQARTVRFQSQPSLLSLSTDLGCLYESGVDLYYNDGNGNQVRITQSGGIVGSPGSISGLTSPASATYVAVNSTFVWQSAVNTPANTDTASVLLRNLVANSKALTLSPPAAMGANYSLVLPSLPGSTSFLTLDVSGNISGSISTTAGLTGSNIASSTITGSNIASATITGGNIAASTIAGSNIGTQTITNTNIASNTIVGSNIAPATIHDSNIAAGTITGGSIASSTITAANIATQTITNTQIATGTIVGSNIASATVLGSNIAASTITGGNVASNINLPGNTVQENGQNVVVSNTNAASSLSIIRASFNTSGANQVGEGYTLSAIGPGQTTMNFNTPFSDFPVVMVGLTSGTAGGLPAGNAIVYSTFISTSAAQINFNNGSFVDGVVAVIVIGRR